MKLQHDAPEPPERPAAVADASSVQAVQLQFLQALRRSDANHGAARQAAQTSAMVELLPQLQRLYDRVVSAPNDLTAVVHDCLIAYGSQTPAFSSASATQLLYECRILRRVLVSCWASNGAPEAVHGVHALMDACMTYIADAFVHEEELLRQSRAHFSLIIDTIPQLVWRTTPDGEATFANKPFLQHVGCTLEEVLGWGWLSVIHPDDKGLVAKEWARCRAAEAPVSVAFRVRGKEGGYRWFLSLGNPFFDHTHTLVAYYGTWTDIDDYKKIEERLENAVRARDDFLCIASHELRTPLTALQLHVQMRTRLLSRGNPAPLPVERVQKMLADDTHQIALIGRLIDDMLDAARVETGMLQITKERMDLCALVHHVVDRYRPILDAAGCPLTVRCHEAVNGLWDTFRIEQLLSNLLTNCARYAPGAPVRVELRRVNDAAQITVQDAGPGIGPSDQERIFGRFERAISANERSGLGLGLYMVREIVRLHGGEVHLDSQVGEHHGCLFTVTLPLDLVAN